MEIMDVLQKLASESGFAAFSFSLAYTFNCPLIASIRRPSTSYSEGSLKAERSE